MVLAKVDGATGDFLSHADEHANARNEVQYEHSAPSCKFGLWVNLAKNPRIKSIEFDALSITTELPKQLALASIALRVMQFSSELLTPQQPPLGASSPFMALGGVLSIELMALPQPPKKVKGWTIRPVAEAGVPIVRQSYPTPAAGGDGMSGSGAAAAHHVHRRADRPPPGGDAAGGRLGRRRRRVEGGGDLGD